MAGFTKLFSQILDSTIWDEPWEVKGVWITLLAMSDSRGRIMASVPGLARRATVTLEQCEAALALFLGPDKYSRTPDNDGRRLEVIDGGWRLLNYTKYREMRDDEARKEYQREWDRSRRIRQKVSESDTVRPQTTKAEAEAEAEKNKYPLPPTGSGEGVKQVRKPTWTKAHPEEVIKATQEIKAIWPRPEDDAFQPDGKTLVPGVSPSELASRLAEIKALGAELDICVKVAARVVSEWKAGKWIKAPQHFFGKAKDSPFRAYYQAYVTNEAVRMAS